MSEGMFDSVTAPPTPMRLCAQCKAVYLLGPSKEGDVCANCATGRTLAARDATIARLTEELEATKPCEPCQRDDHDNCTGDCSSMCCALADAERERDSALADLAAWIERCVAADRDRNALADQRDSLAASLEEARENLEESKEWAADREEAVRQYANSLTVARAELSELRARVAAAKGGK